MEHMTLRQIRKAREYSVKEIADAMGIHFNTYAKWEDHPSEISIAYCYKLCEFLEVPYDPAIFMLEV